MPWDISTAQAAAMAHREGRVGGRAKHFRTMAMDIHGCWQARLTATQGVRLKGLQPNLAPVLVHKVRVCTLSMDVYLLAIQANFNLMYMLILIHLPAQAAFCGHSIYLMGSDVAVCGTMY